VEMSGLITRSAYLKLRSVLIYRPLHCAPHGQGGDARHEGELEAP
jgi:hypothetical protein